ncbi:methyltransferase [Amycolatopsis sp. YIM 10]|uniref:methyltransferase n=1 Tax=Amycolatopsis sp. YIM 10 TaxID=2653857 RepID=UPI00128FDFAE|nr:methyltransferase [Amycolatopsis sp. YIM 10]QFU91070.1 Multifunctional cyclase-dehydratase-3-O-methyl transferase TcmN [Amycolatopsis sp. YIM 10]
MTNTSEDAYRHILGESIAFLYPAALRAAALLELAEQLADGPRDVAELAELTGTSGPYLRRLLRFLASHGTFREDESGRFHLTPQADLLRADAPRSLRAGVLLVTEDGWWQSAADLTEAIRRGEPAFDRRFGKPVFVHLAEHPELGALFDAGMAAYSAGDIGYIVDGYDFPDSGVVVDVGGGRGGLLLAALRARPGLRGILLDQEQVLAGNVLPELGADDRWTPHPGDFFSSVPAGDLYTVKNILHDWSDDQCVRILQNCRRAMNPGGRLLAIDAVIPPGNDPHFGKAVDMLMLLLLPGQERTQPEFERIFDRAGFRITRIIPTPGTVSMIEAVPA